MSIIDQIPEKLASRQIVVARGGHRHDRNWVNYPLKVSGLASMLSKVRIGPKDGAAMTQGEIVSNERKAINVRRNHLIMVDCDTGEPLSSMMAKVKSFGFAAIFWTTHSHMKPESEVSETAFNNWLKRKKIDDALEGPIVDLMKVYLREELKWWSPIVDSVTDARRDLVDGGVKWIITHDPMSRVRIVFFLKEPFEFATRGASQQEAIAEWKDRYKALCEMLNLTYDGKCIDPSRLMYLPAVGSEAAKASFELHFVDGDFVDIDKIRIGSDPDAEADVFANLGSGSSGTREKIEFKTPGFAKHVGVFAKHLELASAFQALTPDIVRSDKGDKIEAECPFDEMHSNAGDPEDRAFFVTDTSMSEMGFAAHCGHATCSAHASVNGKPDRMIYLDQWMHKHDITVDQLLEFCPGYQEEKAEKTEEAKKEKDALDKSIDALTEDSPSEDVDAVLRLIAALPPSSRIDDLIEAVSEKTGRNVGRLRELVRRFQRETGDDEGADNTFTVRRPVPDNPKAATHISDSWSHRDQVRVSKEAFCARNKEDPRLFISSNSGGMVRLRKAGKNTLIEDITGNVPAVSTSLSQALTFVREATERTQEKHVPPFSNVVTEFIGANDLDLPPLAKVIEVPVFSKEGTLRTDKGYDEHLQAWIEPNDTFYDIPAKPSVADVSVAVANLREAYRDFPFVDYEEDSAQKAIRLDEGDEDGFPLPNWDRGPSSFAHMLALTIQPFVRAMIKGPCPNFHVDKAAPGTGAGYLVDVSQIILTGRPAVVQTLSDNEEEFRKEVLATVSEGSQTIFIDNINNHVDMGTLASVLTSNVIKGRLLGRSEMIQAEVAATWIMAGNNLTFSDEIMRRNVPIRLDAGVPDPAADRPLSFYKHKDIHGFVRDNRATLVWSVHTLIQNWIVKGCPGPSDGRTLQSFNGWATVMGGILEQAEVPGFLESWKTYRESKSDDVNSNKELTIHLFERFKENRFTAQEMYDACCETTGGGGLNQFAVTEFKFPDIPIKGRTDAALAKSLSTYAQKFLMDRVTRHDEKGLLVRLTKSTKLQGRTMWQFVAITEGGEKPLL